VAVIRRLVHGVWSLGWLAIVLIGIPAALVHYIGWPFPDYWPTRPEWERWVAQPLTLCRANTRCVARGLRLC
jgi:hypothetical protein